MILVMTNETKRTPKKCLMRIDQAPGNIYVDFWIGKRDYSLTFDKKRRQWYISLAPGVQQRVSTQKTRLLIQELLTNEHERSVRKAWLNAESKTETTRVVRTVPAVNVFRCFAFDQAADSAIAKARHGNFRDAEKQVKTWFQQIEGCERVVVKDFKGRTWEAVAVTHKPEIF